MRQSMDPPMDDDEDDSMGGNMDVGGGGRFAKLKGELSSKGAKNPGGLAAYIGRSKYGPKKMGKMAAKGRKRASK